MRYTQGVRIAGPVLVLLILFWTGEVESQGKSAHSIPIWFGTEVSIAPYPDAAGIWNCEAQLEDLGAKEVLSAPEIVFAAGEEASVQSGLPLEMVWELRVKVDADASEASWSSQVTLSDQVLSVSTGVVRLTSE